MRPFIVNVFKHNQQDATLHNSIYYYKCSYMFQVVLPPIIRSSKLYTQHRVLVELFLLLTATVG
jgi:hypothetical protein